MVSPHMLRTGLRLHGLPSVSFPTELRAGLRGEGIDDMFNKTLLALTALTVCSSYAQTTDIGSLRPVVVTGTRFSDDADRLQQGVSVITARDIESAGISTINEALMKLLGVPGRQDFYGGGNYTLDLRGFGETATSNQIVVVDGLRLNDAELSTPFLASLPIESIDRIEVLRGSGAVLYGGGATGGVISITTKASSGVQRPSGGQLYGALGSNRLRETRASATLASGDLSFDIAANRRETDNHRDNFHSRTEALSLGGKWRNDWLTIGLTGAFDDLDTGLPGSLTAAQYAVNPRLTATPNNHADIHNDRLTAFARADLGAWQIAADAGQRHKELRLASGYNSDVDGDSYSLRAKHQASIGSVNNAVAFGADVHNWSRQTTYVPVATQYTRALFVKDDVTIGGTRLSGGFRSEQVSQRANDGFSLTGGDERLNAWELGVTQSINRVFSTYGRLGDSFRVPNVDEFSSTAVGATLKPQRSRDLEIGGRFVHRGTHADLRLYRSALTNEIGYDPTVGAYGANINYDPTLRRGVELEVKQAVTSALQLRANAAARRATFREGAHAGKEVPLTPHYSAAVRADWRFLPQHQLGVGLNAVSSQHPDQANGCRMPGYVTGDARYARQVGSVQWAVAINNIADRKYYTQAYSCTSGVVNAIYPEPGRTFTASARLQF